MKMIKHILCFFFAAALVFPVAAAGKLQPWQECILLGHAGAPKGKLKMVEIYDPATFRAYLEKTGSGSSMGMAACR